MLARILYLALAMLPLITPAFAESSANAVCRNVTFQADAEPVVEQADDVELSLESGSGSMTLAGDVVLADGVSASRGDFSVSADNGVFKRQSNSLVLNGDITYQGAGANVLSQQAELSYAAGEVEFQDAEFSLGYGAARGAASLMRVNRNGVIDLGGVNYTTCPPDSDDWLVSADVIRLDTQSGFGTAKGLKLRFKGVPILYSPYLSFPISDQRKTGFLLPNIGQSARNGLDISVPWYWNIAPAYDATITPRILSNRGVQLTTQFRYLTGNSRGDMQIAYLPNDDEVNRDRTLLSWNNSTNIADRWRAFVDFTDISDGEYLEDLGGSLSSASVTHLDRTVGLRYVGPYWQAQLRATNYQTIDEAIGQDFLPYRILPGLTVQGQSQQLPLGIAARIDASYERFERQLGTTGNRLHIAPQISLPLRANSLYVEPALTWAFTNYRLDDSNTIEDRDQTRSLPIFSLDSGLKLERESGDQQRFLMTLEPRIRYVHIPFRDQSDLPVFDTIEPVASLEQLYRDNRFIGIDRIGDTDQVTLGITSRLLERSTGRALVTATIGQTRFLSTRAVSLPDRDALQGDTSDYIAELAVNVWGNWNIDIAQQWNTEDSEISKSEIRLQYLPGNNRVVNLAYRYRQDAIDQGDISFSWPIASRWNVVGRYNYSFREDTSLERFFGLEYESCCWGIRVVSRRYISRRDGTADTAIAIQLELKGLSSVGDPADRLLERGILGYRSRID
ncbi:MAG: LPS assembly protein LptD [Pseudomonadota bacterium]